MGRSRRITDYRTVSNRSRSLDDAVNELIALGYEPYGYAFRFGSGVFQTMVKRGGSPGDFKVDDLDEAKGWGRLRTVVMADTDEELMKKVDGLKAVGWKVCEAPYRNDAGMCCYAMIKEQV